MSIRHAKPMTYYSRIQRQWPAMVKPQAAMIPRETFVGHDDVLAAYDLMVTYDEGHRRHSADARDKDTAADTAASEYRAAVAEALATGVDPSKIKNREPQLRAEAEAHRGFAEGAHAKATAHGHVLGKLISDAAESCFPASEKALCSAADEIHAALDALSAAWSTWSAAWAVRRTLSHAAICGGQMAGFNEGTKPPVEVAAALAAIENQIASVDLLKADEAEMTRWRKQEAAAADYIARTTSGLT